MLLDQHAHFSCRPVGQFYSNLPFSGEQGLVTFDQTVVVHLIFSEPVSGLSTSSFTLSGPMFMSNPVSGVRLLRGTNTYYHMAVTLPGDYYGPVTINLQVQLCQVLLQASR